MQSKIVLLNTNSGFTLIEITISVAIIGMIASFGLIATTDSFRGSIFRSEKSIAISVLERARSKSINNYLQNPHGACLDNTDPLKPNYVIFRKTYIPGNIDNEIIPGNSSAKVNSVPNNFYCSNSGIIFEQLTGETSAINLTIIENNRITTVSTNPLGRINW